jgi:hypothetical protein
MTYSTLVRSFVLAAALLGFAAVHVESAWARSDGGGRIYNPSRLRTQRESRSPGRKIRRPQIPEPEQRVPLRSSALIPNPEPKTRGGSGYERKGQYFYETPRDIRLKRTKGQTGYKPSIPRPERVGTVRYQKDGRKR